MSSSIDRREVCDVCIVGAGPHALALAKALVDQGHVVVLVDREMNRNAPRQTMLLQPGGMKTLYDLGVLGALEPGVGKLEGYDYYFERELVTELRYRTLAGCPFPYAIGAPYRMLQEVFIDTLSARPNFRLIEGVTLTEMLRDAYGHFAGITARMQGANGDEQLIVRAQIVVGADHAESDVRRLAGIAHHVHTWDYEAATFRLPRPAGWPSVLSNYRNRGNRYLGVGAYNSEELSVLVGIRKGGSEELKAKGLPHFHCLLEELEPRLSFAREVVKSWDDIVHHKFHSHIADSWVSHGLILIGSAAHNLTTFGGQNMNLALYDAVEAARTIHEALHTGQRSHADLKPFEQRRRPLVETIARLQESVAAPEKEGTNGEVPIPTVMKAQLEGAFRSMALGPFAATPAIGDGAAPNSPPRTGGPPIYRSGFSYDTALNWIWDQLPKRDPVMAKLGQEAAEKKLPIIGPLSGRALYLLTRAIGGRHVFEFGSSIGYSTLWLARAVGEGGQVHYTDRDPKIAERARYYAEEAGISQRIEFMIGDAMESFAATDGDFDVILCDADKRLYPEILRVALPRLREGGLFLADNLFWRGAIFDENPAGGGDLVEPIRTMWRQLIERPDLFVNVLPLGDGLAVAMKDPQY